MNGVQGGFKSLFMLLFYSCLKELANQTIPVNLWQLFVEAISKKSFDTTRQRRTSLCVGTSYQLVEILEYACGLNLAPALTLNQNPVFEMASIYR